MALTDREINAIMHIYRVIKEHGLDLEELETKVEETIQRQKSPAAMENWTSQQWKRFLSPLIIQILNEKLSQVPVRLHDHTNEENGGDAFASKGGYLIE